MSQTTDECHDAMTPTRSALAMQWGPYPESLDDLVHRTLYRPGWKLWLEDMQRDEDHGRGPAGGLTLVIRTDTSNSYHVSMCPECHSPRTGYQVVHYFPVPAATYDERSWRRWLFDCIVKVETHEAAEFFKLWHVREYHDDITPDYERPYAPSHGPGNDPYMVREVGTELDQRTRFTGAVA